MDVIISNNIQSEISPLIKFIREELQQVELATTIVGKSTIAYHLHRSKTGTELLFAPSCHRLPHYISCLSFSTTVYITITI